MINCTISYRGKYADACKCIEDLKDAGIDAGITVGGIWVSIETEDQFLKGQEIAKQHGSELSTDALTGMQRWQTARWEEKKKKS